MPWKMSQRRNSRPFEGAVLEEEAGLQLKDRLKDLMAHRDPPMTQGFLAALADVTQPIVANWLAGTMPDSIHLNRLCEIFCFGRQGFPYAKEKSFCQKKLYCRCSAPATANSVFCSKKL